LVWASETAATSSDGSASIIHRRRLAPCSEGAAESAKLEFEHIIQSINGVPATSREQFATEYKKFRAEKPTEAIVLVVLKRDGQTQTIRIEPPQ